MPHIGPDTVRPRTFMVGRTLMGCQRSDRPLPVLRAGLAALGVEPPATAMAAFTRYADLVLAANTRMNLTAIREIERIERRHFLESVALGVALARAGLFRGDEAVVDVGTGAGFPGLPLRLIWPDLQLTLIEATTKKAGFLADLLHALGVTNVRVVNARAEEAACDPRLRESFDLALSRAVAPLTRLVEWTLPFVRQGGCSAAIKGSRLDEELAAADVAIVRCGGGKPRELPFPVPAPGGEPSPRILVVQKARRSGASTARRRGSTAHPLT